MQRFRITFSKTSAMRFTGHLDLYRAWERLIRRARLPLAFTQGFSPHPKITLASALPLGFTGQAELIDIWFEQSLSCNAIDSALRQAAPPGIDIVKVELVDNNLPSLPSALLASDFQITLLVSVQDLEQRQNDLLSAEALPRTRRNKSYDLRPLILSLERLSDDEQGRQRLAARLSAREAATGRPDEILEAMGIDPLAARVHRTGLVF